MSRDRLHFAFLNIGHFLDHLVVLIFATVAALRLADEWGMSYAALIPYATPGFIAFGLCAVPAGWLADRWSREGMMAVFFFGIGVSAMATAMATTPVQIALGLLAIGAFASIYHPVGLALVIHGRARTGMPLAVNGVFGNLGVAAAALLTGALLDSSGWRSAFVVPGLASIAAGIAYLWLLRGAMAPRQAAAIPHAAMAEAVAVEQPPADRATLVRIYAVILLTTALGGLVFQSITFALPKILDERLAPYAVSATVIGGYAFVVFAVAAVAQIVVGWLIDRHSVRTVFVCVAGLQLALFLAIRHLDGIAALLVAIPAMMAVFGQVPINDLLIGRATRSEWRSRVFGLRYVVTFSVMASTVPLIAWIHSRWGFDALFMVLAGAAATILAGVALLPRTSPLITGHVTPVVLRSAQTGATR